MEKVPIQDGDSRGGWLSLYHMRRVDRYQERLAR